MTIAQRLAEREKELACIYSICLLAAGAPDPEAIAEGLARALCSAMQYEVSTSCTVMFNPSVLGTPILVHRGHYLPDTQEPLPRIEANLPSDSGSWTGIVRIEYADPKLVFLSQEKILLDSVLIITASMLRTSELILDLRSTSESLSAKNVALREVLSMIENDRRRTISAFQDRLASELLPLAERARDASLSSERRSSYVDLIASELGRDLSILGPGAATSAALSLREREIAVQVRNGRTSKEIAELLGISNATVERHRHNIRKKLRIANMDVNLAGLLSNNVSIDDAIENP